MQAIGTRQLQKLHHKTSFKRHLLKPENRHDILQYIYNPSSTIIKHPPETIV